MTINFSNRDIIKGLVLDNLVSQGFNQHEERPLGKVRLHNLFGDIESVADFYVIDAKISYNVIIG